MFQCINNHIKRKGYTLKTILYTFLILFIVYFLSDIIYTETFIYQSVILSPYIAPINRSLCHVQKVPTHNIFSNYHDDLRVDTSLYIDATKSSSTSTGTSTVGSRKYKIAFVLLYDDTVSHDIVWNHDVMTRMLSNKRKYCDEYSYDLINANADIDYSRPAAWSKLIGVKNALHHSNGYDYVVYMDMDVVIMNFSITIESFIDVAISSSASPSSADLIMTTDWNGPNTGIWIIKNTDWSKRFMQDLWDQKQLIQARSSDGTKYPFEYEQRAFHYLLDSNIWRSRGLPQYDTNKIEENRGHITFLPQCSLNAYSLHPFDLRGDRDSTQYVDGDFLIHFAGKKGKQKLYLMEYYLFLAESSDKL